MKNEGFRGHWSEFTIGGTLSIQQVTRDAFDSSYFSILKTALLKTGTKKADIMINIVNCFTIAIFHNK